MATCDECGVGGMFSDRHFTEGGGAVCDECQLKVRAKITYMWGDWETYTVDNIMDCRDDTDKSAYMELLRDSGARVIQMGKVCVERI